MITKFIANFILVNTLWCHVCDLILRQQDVFDGPARDDNQRLLRMRIAYLLQYLLPGSSGLVLGNAPYDSDTFDARASAFRYPDVNG